MLLCSPQYEQYIAFIDISLPQVLHFIISVIERRL